MIIVKIIKEDDYEKLEVALNTYLSEHTNALLKQVVIEPRGNSDKELCYAVVVEVSD